MGQEPMNRPISFKIKIIDPTWIWTPYGEELFIEIYYEYSVNVNTL